MVDAELQIDAAYANGLEIGLLDRPVQSRYDISGLRGDAGGKPNSSVFAKVHRQDTFPIRPRYYFCDINTD